MFPAAPLSGISFFHWFPFKGVSVRGRDPHDCPPPPPSGLSADEGKKENGNLGCLQMKRRTTGPNGEESQPFTQRPFCGSLSVFCYFLILFCYSFLAVFHYLFILFYFFFSCFIIYLSYLLYLFICFSCLPLSCFL